AARVARRISLACCALCIGSGSRAQAVGGQLLGAAAVLDQSWIVERQLMAGAGFDQGLECVLIDLTVIADQLPELLRTDLRGLGFGQVDGAGGEVHGKGDQSGDHVEESADGVGPGDYLVDPAFDLAPAIRVEDRAAGGQLGKQSSGHDAGNYAGFRAHEHLQKKWRNYSSSPLQSPPDGGRLSIRPAAAQAV